MPPRRPRRRSAAESGRQSVPCDDPGLEQTQGDPCVVVGEHGTQVASATSYAIGCGRRAGRTCAHRPRSPDPRGLTRDAGPHERARSLRPAAPPPGARPKEPTTSVPMTSSPSRARRSRYKAVNRRPGGFSTARSEPPGLLHRSPSPNGTSLGDVNPDANPHCKILPLGPSMHASFPPAFALQRPCGPVA